ncbi:filamentous hemagglutinin [Burkholderia ubonensis]|uniref:Filamentous hemagglutinin n=1 Tax=Burkholderia ubonensis TaxID=101571 RepID=A0A103QLS1_9BURK|nr:filamentous hemagglutinin N-terminal domain-containing protein [Burkholderia ubonensis]KVG51717.1 filamentous hemagglutinin [Burkholderia ubonensis]
MFLALSSGLPAAAHAAGPLPGGGQFVAGAGSITGNGTSLTINQTSGRGVIDWASFSIGNDNRVTFNNGAGATLNRVTGGNPSTILGTLTATGSVYLINPQGIVVGPSGVISTGGRFVASTLDTDNTAFMTGGPLALSGNANASVVNLGKIGSTGGDVFLIARGAVDNRGSIGAPNGTAELTAGQTVLLRDASGSRQVFVQTGSGGIVLNGGAIEAAQISLQAADGNVFALAGQHEVLRATGTATRDGHIWLVADHGTVNLANQIEAANADGSGGTVDTVAGMFGFARSGPVVLAGIWNITIPCFTIDTPAATAFARSLNAGTSVNLQTTGANGQSGDIIVASNIQWSRGASLTLGAYRTLTVDKGVTIGNQGSGNLTLRADATGIDNGGSVINNGTIDWSKSTGIVSALYDMNGSYTPGTLIGNAAWSAPLYSGLVTQITAYQLLNSGHDLITAAGMPAGNYALGEDIQAGASEPLIGESNTPFIGQFDGMGHTIDGLAGALFGAVGETGVVRNLALTNDSVPYPFSGIFPNGLLANVNKGLVANVSVTGNIYDGLSGSSNPVGGIVGINDGTILRSSANVDIQTYGVTGGIAGINNGLIDQSYSMGNVGSPLSYQYAGALVGDNRGTISSSYSTAQTGGYTASALVYYNEGVITQSFAAGRDWSGIGAGIAYQNSGAITPNVYWDKDATQQARGVAAGNPLPDANGLSTAQMGNAASFVGWDFSANGVWAMPAGSTHPVLRWQLERPANATGGSQL